MNTLLKLIDQLANNGDRSVSCASLMFCNFFKEIKQCKIVLWLIIFRPIQKMKHTDARLTASLTLNLHNYIVAFRKPPSKYCASNLITCFKFAYSIISFVHFSSHGYMNFPILNRAVDILWPVMMTVNLYKDHDLRNSQKLLNRLLT